MQTNAYLFFDGNCEAAFKFYEKHLGGKIEMLLTGADLPEGAEEIPTDMHDRVMHVRMTLGDTALMGSDAMPGRRNKPQGFDVNITVDTPEEAKRIFNALTENGEIKMPLDKTFFATCFGSLVDQFGVPWMVSCD